MLSVAPKKRGRKPKNYLLNELGENITPPTPPVEKGSPKKRGRKPKPKDLSLTEKPVLKNVIKQVANKNIKQIQTWKNEHPDCIHAESKKNDQYMNIVMNSMSGGTSEEQQNNISQIVKNVSKAVVIEKKALQ